jgi:hypothetical protein
MWRKLQNEYLHIFYHLRNFFMVIRSKTACSTHVEDINTDKILVGKFEDEKSFCRTRY